MDVETERHISRPIAGELRVDENSPPPEIAVTGTTDGAPRKRCQFYLWQERGEE